MLRQLTLIFGLWLLCAVGARAQTRQFLQGDCERGNNVVTTDGRVSVTKVQRSFSACNVTVYDSGTTDLATIASNESGTPKANPFVADVDGHWGFWATVGRYDVKMDGSGIPTAFTRPNQWVVVPTGGSFNLTVKEADGTPTVQNVDTISFSGATVTDDGSGDVTVTVTGGGGTCPGGTTTQVLYNNAGSCASIAGAVAVSAGSILQVTNGRFVSNLMDVNGNELIGITSAASATTFLNVANGATGVAPVLSGMGETNTDLALDASGTGVIVFRQASLTVPVTLTDAASINTDASLSNRFRVTLGGNRTLATPTNLRDGQQLVWEFLQDGTGTRTLGFSSAFQFGAEITSCTVSPGAGTRSFITAIYNSGPNELYIVGCVTGY